MSERIGMAGYIQKGPIDEEALLAFFDDPLPWWALWRRLKQARRRRILRKLRASGPLTRCGLQAQQMEFVADTLRPWMEQLEREAEEAISLAQLRAQLSAWHIHCATRGLTDRIELMDWLKENLTYSEFAAIVDGEIGRDSIRQTYLKEVYGP